MSTLLQLGAFGGGFIQGRNAEQDRRHVMESRERERRMKDMQEKANAAARDAYQGYAKQFEPRTEEQVTAVSGGPAQTPAIQGNGLGLGGGTAMPSPQFGDMSEGNKPSLGGMGLAAPQERVPTQQAQVQAPGKFDEREGILAGLSARRKYLMEQGADPEAWMGDWAKESQLRGMLRSERIQAAEQRFLATRDPGEYAKMVYPLIEDGMELVGTKPIKTVDGQQAWQFIRRDAQGKEMVDTMTLPEFQQFMMGVRDPKAVAEYEAKSLYERMKADQAVRQKQGEQAAVQGTEAVKLANNLTLEDARFKNDRALKGMVSGDKLADLRAPRTLSGDQVLVAPGKDGKYETLAKGPAKADAQTSAENRKLNLRALYANQIRSNPDLAEQLMEDFRSRTGEDY